MLRILPLLLTLLLSNVLVMGQDLSWKKHKKTAEQLYSQGKYVEAAMHYEKAWEKKPENRPFLPTNKLKTMMILN